jgi:hypothetical protein
MKKIILLSITLIVIVIHHSCKDETELTLPYAGAWETDVYAVSSDTLGSLINQKMIFVFEDDRFSDTIFHVIGYLEQPVFLVSGLIDQAGGAKLHFTLTQLGEVLGTRIDWDSLGTNGFDSLYTVWLETFMPSEFDASYAINGNELELIIAETSDTIHLFHL